MRITLLRLIGCCCGLVAFAVAPGLSLGSEGGTKPAGCGCGVRYVCCPKWKTEKVERKGYEVECEAICVPRVRLPWQSCCAPRCARVICVNRLKTATKECGEKWVLTWEAQPVCTRCGKCCTPSVAPACCAPCGP